MRTDPDYFTAFPSKGCFINTRLQSCLCNDAHVLSGRTRGLCIDLPHTFQGRTDLGRHRISVVDADTGTSAMGIAPPMLVPVDVSHRGSFHSLLASVQEQSGWCDGGIRTQMHTGMSFFVDYSG